ncbi:MAG TPA: hypothetical protein VIE63_02350 [Ramlibacter sp.]
MRSLFTWKKLALAGALCTGAWLAHASDAPDRQCRVPVDERGALPDRTAAISRMEQMSDACLKRLLFQCGDAANQRVMDLGSASTCSMGYEALLHKSFGGDFVAMLAWWRGERAARAPTP